jgi:hypothetical protein
MARGGRQHLAHAGPALGAFVADDDDVALLDLAVEDALQRLFFGSKHDGAAGEAQAFLAGDLSRPRPRGEVAAQDDEVAVFLDRVVEAADDVLALG